MPHPNTAPSILFNEFDLQGSLPGDVVTYIQGADTVFLGASYAPDMDMQNPLHVETNIRGGRPGFIRVSPFDGRTIVLPDFSGTHSLHVQAFFFATQVMTIEPSVRKSVNYVTRQ